MPVLNELPRLWIFTIIWTDRLRMERPPGPTEEPDGAHLHHERSSLSLSSPDGFRNFDVKKERNRCTSPIVCFAFGGGPEFAERASWFRLLPMRFSWLSVSGSGGCGAGG